jgi:hypothetical protein
MRRILSGIGVENARPLTAIKINLRIFGSSNLDSLPLVALLRSVIPSKDLNMPSRVKLLN